MKLSDLLSAYFVLLFDKLANGIWDSNDDQRGAIAKYNHDETRDRMEDHRLETRAYSFPSTPNRSGHCAYREEAQGCA